MVGAWWVRLTLLGAVQALKSRVSPDGLPHHGKCEPVTIPLCKDMPYNDTIMPNLLGHTKQEDAGLEVHQYFPLVKVKCNPNLQFFLCSVYVPVCTILEKPIPPCRSLCLSARQGCDTLMETFGFPWPDSLDCDKFPDPPDICVENNTTSSSSPKYKPPTFPKPSFPTARPNAESAFLPFPNIPEGAVDLGFVCPVQFKVPKGMDYSLKVGDKIEKDCGAPCDGMFFSDEQRKFGRIWVGVWSSLCAVSCLMTVLTFLIDTDRFRYPERPIIFLSLCYFMVASAYIVGFWAGDTISCRKPFPSPVDLPKLPMVSTITQGTKHEPCTILFMIIYFFGMASSVWWVVLTLTWFLAAGLKWGHEAIEANSQYFHLAAWAVPAIKTITILAMGKVEGNNLFNFTIFNIHFVLILFLFFYCLLFLILKENPNIL